LKPGDVLLYLSADTAISTGDAVVHNGITYEASQGIDKLVGTVTVYQVWALVSDTTAPPQVTGVR